MNKGAFVLALALALVAACNRSPQVDEKDASVGEVAEKVRKAGADQAFVRPGEWQSTVTIDKLEVPGMPPEVAQRMKTMMAEQQAHSFKTCLTKEDVQKPKEDFFTGKSKECRYERFTMGNGKIDAVMHCGSDGARQTMQMAGTYSPDKYAMQMSTKVEAGGEPEGGMSMQMRVEAQRVGECAGKG
jgi:hypothetical protein